MRRDRQGGGDAALTRWLGSGEGGPPRARRSSRRAVRGRATRTHRARSTRSTARPSSRGRAQSSAPARARSRARSLSCLCGARLLPAALRVPEATAVAHPAASRTTTERAARGAARQRAGQVAAEELGDFLVEAVKHDPDRSRRAQGALQGEVGARRGDARRALAIRRASEDGAAEGEALQALPELQARRAQGERMRPHDLWSRHRRRQPAARLRQATLERSSAVPCPPARHGAADQEKEGDEDAQMLARRLKRDAAEEHVVCVGEPLARWLRQRDRRPALACTCARAPSTSASAASGRRRKSPGAARRREAPRQPRVQGARAAEHRPRPPRRARRHRRAGDPGGRLGRRQHLGCLDRSDGRRRRRAPRRRRQRRRRRRRLAQAAHRPRRRRRRRAHPPPPPAQRRPRSTPPRARQAAAGRARRAT